MCIRKQKMLAAAVLLAAVCSLTGCGDDPDITVPVLKPSDLAEPIPGFEPGQGTQNGEGSLGNHIGESTGNLGEAQGTPGEASRPPASQDGSGKEALQGAEIESPKECPDEESPVTITISAAGDVTLGNHQNQDYYYSFRQAYDQAEDKGYFFENVRDIFREDDLTIVNLEGPLTFSDQMTEGLTYNIKGDPDYAYLLNPGCIEAVSFGNNHRLDYGEAGSEDTVEALEKAGVVYAFDENVGIYEVKGIRIGFVSVNEVYWGAGVEKTMQAGIEKLKEEEADLILACCHWGTERENYPEPYQTTLGRKCIDWGADLVIGHHPHVLQGVDKYQGKYIVYSLGNFCFGANRNPEDKDTMIFQQTFTFTEGVKQEDENVRIIPCSVSSVTTRNDFRPTPAQGEEAARIIDRVNEFSKGYGVEFGKDGSVMP